MRKRVREELTLSMLKDRLRSLEKRLAKMTIDQAGSSTSLNTTTHWQDVGRYKLLYEVLFTEDQ